MHMAHTQSCARTHDTQTEEDKASGRWVLDGNTEEGGEAGTSTGGRGTGRPLGGGRVGGVSGVEVDGVRQHARASLECNHHCKNMRVCTFQN